MRDAFQNFHFTRAIFPPDEGDGKFSPSPSSPQVRHSPANPTPSGVAYLVCGVGFGIPITLLAFLGTLTGF